MKPSQYLLLLLSLLWTEGFFGKETSHENKRAQEETARSANIGIKSQDIAITATGKSVINKDQDSGGSIKPAANLFDELPEVLQEEQHLTDTALDYSSKLSPLDQRLVKQFDSVTSRKNGDSSSRATSSTDAREEENNGNRNNRNLVEQVANDETGRNDEFNPIRDLKQDISTLRNGRLDKDFYSQISQIEGDQPTPSYVGKLSAMYDKNPMPEYSYKESFSDFSSDSGGQDKYNKFNPFEMPKDPSETPTSEFDQDDREKELFQDFSKNEHSSSDKSDLFSKIGKEVFLDYLNKQNASQSLENLKKEFLKKIMAGNSIHKESGSEPFLVNKLTATTSPVPFHFPTLPSQSNRLASGRISSSEALPTKTQQITGSLSVPNGISLGVKGNVFQDEQHIPTRMITDEQLPTVRQQSPTDAEMSNNLKNFETNSDKTALTNLPQSDVENSENKQFVTLKISGAGRPVSFRAGTSNDGSLLLKIPGNITLVDSNVNKDIPGETTSSHEENDKFRTEMASNDDQIDDYLSKSQENLFQEFAKKEKMIKGKMDNSNKELQGWQILGKTNAKINQDTTGHNFASNTLQDDHVVASSVTPTQGRALNGLYILPTAIHELSELAPAKYHELSRVSFAGVGKSPPSKLLSPGLKIHQNVENNNILSLKSFLTPSKFLEASPVNRASLDYGTDHISVNSPFNRRVSQEQIGRAGLRLHNKFRAWHNSPPLKWSSSLAAKAQRIAQEMAGDPIHLADLEAANSGINIASLKQDYDIAAEKATAQWYSEIKSYNFGKPRIRNSNRHFTQLIWRDSKKIGIGEAKSSDGRHTYVVALYDPPGNIRMRERSNIRLPKSRN
ncbi:uncharacterized protein LOC114965693 isoform X5 [Acropora millepora]|uniref:uncharacterized protein LOC114965693 isoform X5 n=1 Tax=Acropora millepora TaxID=45264 RepID=UPI001CF2E7A7|nr:uncharacterized protein LOC114965693 isoform X5 [Acropora millepora]